MNLKSLAPVLMVSCLALTASCKSRTPSSGVRNDTAADAPAPEDAVKRINELIGLYQGAVSEQKRDEVRQTAWDFMNLLDKKGVLDNVISLLIAKVPQSTGLTDEQKKAYADQVYGFIKVEVDNRRRFENWEAVDAKLVAAVGRTSTLKFDKALEALSGSPLLGMPKGNVLINGEASWTVRKQLIAGAKTSIWIFCWAFYNDKTGNEGVELLINRKRANPELDIRVMVDGPTESKPGYTESVQKLIDANIGIQLIRWSHPDLNGFGMHRKILMVDHNSSEADGAAAVFGGMNYGDNYSHENAANMKPIDLWRDTDMVVYGLPVKQAAGYFARSWNNFVDLPGRLVSSPNLTKVTVPTAPRGTVKNSGGQFAFVDQDPAQIKTNPNYLDPIYLVTLKMIESAQKSVDISNAYFITSLPIQRSLARAMNRGVQVRVHTNADESLCPEDKPLLGPIYRSLRGVLQPPGGGESGGAPRTAAYRAPQVFLQKDHTLHSKYMVVDGQWGWLGSYNIHPRSYRYEGESVGMFVGQPLAGQVQSMFDDDARASTPATLEAVTLPANPMFDLLESFFFEQL